MNKEEFLKIQTCVLKVNIHCDGCKHKVKKILQKIEGVYTVKIDSDQGKVAVSGTVDPSTLIKKLIKNGKHAEIWGVQKPNNNNNQNQLNNQFKGLQIDHGKDGNNKEQGHKGGGGGGGNNNNLPKGGGNINNQPKGGGNNNNQSKGGPQGQNPQLQQLQPMKGFPDLKMGQFMKDMKMPSNNKDKNVLPVKFKLPEDDGMSDDDFDDDDFEDDDEFDDDDLDDDMDDGSLHKMKPMMGNGHGGGMPNMIMHNMMNGQNPQLTKGGAGGIGGNNGGGNGKKGGIGGAGGNIPVQMNHGGSGVGNGGKKGGNGNNNSSGGNQNQGGGKGGKSGGGIVGQNKNGVGDGANGNGGNFMANGAKKLGGMSDGHHGMPNMMAMKGAGPGAMGSMPMGPMGSMPMGPMGNMSMGNLAAVQGLPASAAMGGGAGGGGYFQGGGPDHMPGNPYQQQQMAAMMMNQQRANGNERFQPMMYARPPPAVNYMPPYPHYPYPPPGDRVDQYTMFSDENTSSCTVM